MRKITEADVKRTVKFWTAALKLDHWKLKIVIGEELSSETRLAEIELSDDYYKGTMKLSPEWRTWTIAELEEVVVHELMHVHLHQLCMAAFEGPDIMGKEAYDLYEKRFIHELESAVEAITQSVVGIAWS